VLGGPDSGKQWKAFARIGSLGIELALSIVIGLLGGRWLDGKLDTAPYLTLLGLILGSIAGFKSLVQTARRQSQRSDQDSQHDSKQRGNGKDDE
jgi:F0F1-type ATP synthase assembly protein I